MGIAKRTVMNIGLYQAAAALNANSRWQEAIAQNLASSSIPGFKKQDMSFGAVAAGMMPAPAQGLQHFALPNAAPATNFKSGELKFTGVKTDVALEGNGFFAIQMPDGATAYTRDGEFHVGTSGQLVTKQGHAVLGEAGPIQLDPGNPAPISISATGEVSQGAELKGTLKAVGFNDQSLLTPISSGYFLATNPYVKATAASATFHQGYLEGSNTSPTAEMVHLITAMRMYEANQRVIQSQDDRMSHAIAELGNS